MTNYIIDLAKANGGRLNASHVDQTINHMEGVIQDAHNSGMRLNQYMRSIR
jgi:hypothetical protein